MDEVTLRTVFGYVLIYDALLLANFVIVAGSYGFAFLVDSDDDDETSSSNQPAWLKFVYKSLDFGSGRERGARK